MEQCTEEECQACTEECQAEEYAVVDCERCEHCLQVAKAQHDYYLKDSERCDYADNMAWEWADRVDEIEERIERLKSFE